MQRDTEDGLPVRRIKSWLTDAALPLWLSQGLDPVGGGFAEALSLDGAALADLPKRLRVQARQIYVASHAALLGLSTGALAAASAGYAFMTEHGWHPEGGWIHLLDPRGKVLEGTRDTYDHAFVLLALGWYYRASGESGALDWIERTLAYLDRALADGTGAYRERIPAALPRRQNPHMHLLEAMLGLHAATGERLFLDRAGKLFELFQARFFNSAKGILLEYFDDAWKPVAESDGAIVEPGHHCEWVWLLDRFERLTGRNTARERSALADFAFRFGRDPVSGLLVDELYPDGRIKLGTMRCWPQCEGLKAKLVSLERGESAARADVAHFANGLLDRYLATSLPGLWQDRFSAEGKPLARQVPASTLYHLFLAFAELLRVAGAVPTGPMDAVPLGPP